MLLSVRGRDDKAVEHNYQQLKTYYADGRHDSAAAARCYLSLST